MVNPIGYSLNKRSKPIYDLKDILDQDSSKIDGWLDRDDIIILELKKVEPNVEIEDEFDYLNNVLEEIDKLEVKFKLND